MKIKLVYKIFFAFLLTSLLVVILLVGTMRYYVSRHFADYVNMTVLERLAPLIDELAAEYRRYNGWGDLKENPNSWHDLLRSGLAKSDFNFNRQGQDSGTAEKASDTEAGAAGSDSNEEKELPGRVRWLTRALALFDANKGFIAGREEDKSSAGYTLEAIDVDGRTVGWLGLHKMENLSNPLVVSFLKQNSAVSYQVGAGILLLAALVSFLLSKHLLSPIRQLTTGTQALRHFKFDARIDVRTKDELGELAADFNVMAATLKRYETLRRQWISDISHELRTPLAILRGEIEALQDGVRKPTQENLESLHAEVVRFSKLVEGLHLLSLADSRSLLPEKEPVEPISILNVMVAHFRPRLERKGIELRTFCSTDETAIVQGDADKLSQLFSNLLENALRYTDAPGRLEIHCRRKEDRLQIDFQDSAPGVPPEALGRLFDRLYRVDKSRSRALGGSGLGLAICKEIVEAHRGTIRAADSPLGGVSIELELPLAGGGIKGAKPSE